MISGREDARILPLFAMRMGAHRKSRQPAVARATTCPENRHVQPNPRLGAWRAFLEAHTRVIDLLEAELQARKGLSLAWYDVLVQLSEAEGHELRMTDLARRVLLSKSGLTRLIDRMCDEGLVTRTQDAEDRRGRRVCLSSEGEARLRDAAPAHLRGVAEHFTNLLTDEEAVLLDASLRRIAAAASTHDA